MSENERPLVSIVTPVYNAGSYIAGTIESVLAQDCDNWELILVDDLSTDNSVSVIEGFLTDTRIRLVRGTRKLGAAKARNEGIKIARGGYLTFLDADDLWKETKLSRQLAFLKRNHAAFSFTSYEFGDTDARPTGRIVHAPEKLNYRQALSRTVIFTSTVMFRLSESGSATALSKTDCFFPDCPSEDTALWWRILRSGYSAAGLDEVLTVYRRPSGSLSSNKLTAIKRIWNLYRREEGFNILKSARYFIPWAVRATLRRL